MNHLIFVLSNLFYISNLNFTFEIFFLGKMNYDDFEVKFVITNASSSDIHITNITLSASYNFKNESNVVPSSSEIAKEFQSKSWNKLFFVDELRFYSDNKNSLYGTINKKSLYKHKNYAIMRVFDNEVEVISSSNISCSHNEGWGICYEL